MLEWMVAALGVPVPVHWCPSTNDHVVVVDEYCVAQEFDWVQGQITPCGRIVVTGRGP